MATIMAPVRGLAVWVLRNGKLLVCTHERKKKSIYEKIVAVTF